jgi:IclR family transcriptional regulator, acetate operon repressor
MGISSGQTGSRGYSLPILDRATVLLEEIACACEPPGVSALARRTGIPKTSVDRLVATLKSYDLVSSEGSGLVIGPRMLQLAEVIQQRTAENLGHVLLPLLIELYEKTGDFVLLAVLDGPHAVVVQTLAGPSRRHLEAHRRLPAHRCAAGKALLAPHAGTPSWPETLSELRRSTPRWNIDAAALAAELHRIRRQGFATHRRDDGTAELAMPVVGLTGPVAALARIRRVDRPFDRTTIDLQHQIAVAASASLRPAAVATARAFEASAAARPRHGTTRCAHRTTGEW